MEIYVTENGLRNRFRKISFFTLQIIFDVIDLL